ncbi:hypothetical protein F441_04898 [Phytophthora nicotianae CJ01A1]|uniref:Late endosomal/lysosomal adaptor and MAPK and MTOR activator 5 n=6 Tax=Phytophthora nicotianae TaxID=4792 RepID=W2QJ53_PHYN3|nr:hypothetical protein PPTG_09137 [Phytophthora nicotianae INRA-310]ETI51828.1 hypothetical protein F443_04901 [Phytophthora nicotianae P1569]ETK91717.1 hypothetical protein L915_04765 [Phytophthora nicotianae]ETO80644.1 hypothetical protein F444_04940 [Phytophthora nicotianae P1976]ETP21673.1 hypothetical protein F441_04898 [Phytophthora nicotianae CJ01A1]ETP49566.1 hypothetical protein F442_04969 [Phytophthora nicotianae P10297]KUF87816.1 hypothetical protein AM587_10006706 [Phytophthora n
MSVETLGLVLNDGHGLLLKAEGDLAYTARDQKNGFFTCIAEKAIDLGQFAEGDDDDAAEPDEDQPLPTVRLETSRRSLLIAKFETGGRERTLVVSKPRGHANTE